METWLLIGCRLCDVTMFLQKMLFYAVILRNFGKLVSYNWFSSANTPFQLSIIKSRRWDVSFNRGRHMYDRKLSFSRLNEFVICIIQIQRWFHVCKCVLTVLHTIYSCIAYVLYGWLVCLEQSVRINANGASLFLSEWEGNKLTVIVEP